MGSGWLRAWRRGEGVVRIPLELRDSGVFEDGEGPCGMKGQCPLTQWKRPARGLLKGDVTG